MHDYVLKTIFTLIFVSALMIVPFSDRLIIIIIIIIMTIHH